MRKVSIKFVSFSLALVFLLSFTGLRMIMHQCMSCNSTELTVFDEEPVACHHSSESPIESCCEVTETADTCCKSEINNAACENCCSEEVVYLKSKYELVTVNEQFRLVPQVLAILPVVSGLAVPEAIEEKGKSIPHYSQPPPRYVGKDFVVYSHQLKIS